MPSRETAELRDRGLFHNRSIDVPERLWNTNGTGSFRFECLMNRFSRRGLEPLPAMCTQKPRRVSGAIGVSDAVVLMGSRKVDMPRQWQLRCRRSERATPIKARS
jgi:hypothetical protein